MFYVALLLSMYTAIALELHEAKMVVSSEWNKLQKQCHLGKATIEVQLDPDLADTTTLAWARHARVLQNGVWWPSVLTDYDSPPDISIGINPNKLWATECNQLGQQLRMVVLHEILHGLGISSSIRASGRAGFQFGGRCFPTLFDTKIHNDKGETTVLNCEVDIQQDLYVNNVKLYHPIPFSSGSSLSHHDTRGGIIAPWPPSQCIPLSDQDINLLAALGIICDNGNITNNANKNVVNNTNNVTYRKSSSSLQTQIQSPVVAAVLLTMLGLS
jgi:hypothetical protein